MTEGGKQRGGQHDRAEAAFNGLVRAGWGYGSDELAVLSFTVGSLKPYQRPISVDVGAYHVFPELVGDVYRMADEQWHVDPRHLGATAQCAQSEQLPAPTHLLFPTFEPGVPTRLSSLTAAQTLHQLIGHSVNLLEHGAVGFERLCHLAEQCAGATLHSGDLAGQLGAIDEWMNP